ncbi:hypothetical protein NDU88_002381 [Pleurodeles waltl]|uniref:Uncharacterized protein n=1 Tax=Pleurodeles waltl TaxID=8319 RepID=A0AAV7TLN3_PLEWA|nr:hypothetical protein NDU88_002381 [Pleurodeles waltl]
MPEEEEPPRRVAEEEEQTRNHREKIIRPETPDEERNAEPGIGDTTAPGRKEPLETMGLIMTLADGGGRPPRYRR